MLGLEEATISKQHVQLHRIVYEQGKTGISPMVYIRNLSRNATSLIKASMAESLSENCQTITLRRQSAPQLLNDGDILSLSPTVHVQMTFPSLVYSDTGLSALQRAEIKVLPVKPSCPVRSNSTSSDIQSTVFDRQTPHRKRCLWRCLCLPRNDFCKASRL